MYLPLLPASCSCILSNSMGVVTTIWQKPAPPPDRISRGTVSTPLSKTWQTTWMRSIYQTGEWISLFVERKTLKIFVSQAVHCFSCYTMTGVMFMGLYWLWPGIQVGQLTSLLLMKYSSNSINQTKQNPHNSTHKILLRIMFLICKVIITSLFVEVNFGFRLYRSSVFLPFKCIWNTIYTALIKKS